MIIAARHVRIRQLVYKKCLVLKSLTRRRNVLNGRGVRVRDRLAIDESLDESSLAHDIAFTIYIGERSFLCCHSFFTLLDLGSDERRKGIS